MKSILHVRKQARSEKKYGRVCISCNPQGIAYRKMEEGMAKVRRYEICQPFRTFKDYAPEGSESICLIHCYFSSCAPIIKLLLLLYHCVWSASPIGSCILGNNSIIFHSNKVVFRGMGWIVSKIGDLNPFLPSTNKAFCL